MGSRAGLIRLLLVCLAFLPFRAFAQSSFFLHEFTGYGDKIASGDVNGDGIPDIIIGKQNANTLGLTGNGQVKVFSGANWSLLYTLNGGANLDAFGQAVASGDWNGDGNADIIVGAFLADNGAVLNTGKVYVYSGLNGSLLAQINGNGLNAYFGFSLAAKDIDTDGTSEILVGEYRYSTGLTGRGRASLWKNLAGAATLRTQIVGAASGEELGYSVALIDDVSGDGLSDIVAGAWKATTYGANPLYFHGKVYCASGAVPATGITAAALWTHSGGNNYGNLGSSVAASYSLDGSGIPSVIVGSWNDTDYAQPTPQANQGSVSVLQGNSGTSINDQAMATPAPIRYWGVGMGDNLGYSVSASSLFPLIYLSLPNADMPLGDVGSVFSFIVSGAGSGSASFLFNDIFNGSNASQKRGARVLSISDINQDAIPDMVVSDEDAAVGGRVQVWATNPVTPIIGGFYSFGSGCVTAGMLIAPSIGFNAGSIVAGGTLQVSINNLPPNTPAALQVGPAYPGEVAMLLPFNGCNSYVELPNPAAPMLLSGFHYGNSDNNGQLLLTFPIPPAPPGTNGFAGLSAYFQGGSTTTLGSGVGLNLTSGYRVFAN